MLSSMRSPSHVAQIRATGISFRCDDDKMIMMVDSLLNGGPASTSGLIQK